MFLIYISLIFLALIVYIHNSKSLPQSFLFLGILLGVTAGIEIVKYYVKIEYYIKLSIVDHLFHPIEFTFISVVYYNILSNKINKIIVKYTVPTYIITSLIVSTIEGWTKISVTSFLIESFILVVYSVMYVKELFHSVIYENVLRKPFFWINTGLLFYCAGTFFFMGVYEYLNTINPNLASETKIINYVLNIFLYFCYLIGFSCKSQKS